MSNESVNDFFTKFIDSHHQDEDEDNKTYSTRLKQLWYTKENQAKLKKLCMQSSTTRKSTKKDPKAPKRAQSAYLFFCSQHRAKLKEENPNLDFKALGVEIGKRWKEASDKEKEPFVEQARKDKERYEREIKEYKN